MATYSHDLTAAELYVAAEIAEELEHLEEQLQQLVNSETAVARKVPRKKSGTKVSKSKRVQKVASSSKVRASRKNSTKAEAATTKKRGQSKKKLSRKK